MRRAVALVVLGVAAWSASPTSEACGDKFLVIGRGIRRVPRAAHPASILLYMKPGSQLPAAAHDLRLGARLKQAGHSVALTQDAAGLQHSLASERFDLVIADLNEARQIHTQRPLVVPLLYGASEEELNAGRAESRRIVKAPERGLAFLAVIDEASQSVSRPH